MRGIEILRCGAKTPSVRLRGHQEKNFEVIFITRDRVLFALLLLTAALLAFWGLGALPLFDVDEPVYAEVGKEMARGGWGGWLTPHWNGQVWFDKPPLFYWLTAISMRLLGPTEFAARLPSALMCLVLVAAAVGLARRAFPAVRHACLWSGFILATCLQSFMLTRAAVTDMTLAALLTLALLGMYVWTQTGKASAIVLAGVMTGLAMLTKGPVAFVLIGLQAIAYLCLMRQPRRLLSGALWGAVSLCLLVALPWYGAMVALHGQQFVQGFLEANNLTRFLKPEHRETQNLFYFALVLPLGFLPWTVALVPGVIAAAKQARDEWRGRAADAPALFLCLWCALVFVFFSASQTKLITYIFPLYPAAAILAGRWIAERATQSAFALRAVFAALIAMIGIVLLAEGRKYGVANITLTGWGAVTVLSVALLLTTHRAAGRWLVPGAAFGLFLLIAWCSPVWRIREVDISERLSARAASALVPAGATIHVLHQKHPSLLFYATRPVIFTDDWPRAAADMNSRTGAVYVTRPEVLADLRKRYGVHGYRVHYAAAHTLVIQTGK